MRFGFCNAMSAPTHRAHLRGRPHADPEKWARLANAIAVAYLDEQTFARTEVAQRATVSLSSRLAEQRERLRQAEEQSELYKAQHNIVGATGRFVDEQQLTELNNQLITARGRTAEANARYSRRCSSSAPVAIAAQPPRPSSRTPWAVCASNTVRSPGKKPTSPPSSNRAISMSSRPVPNCAIPSSRSPRRSSVSPKPTQRLERARAKETALERNLEALKQGAKDTSLAFVKLRELEREVEASRAVYELGRSRETREQERLDTTNARILVNARRREIGTGRRDGC
jgi:succinoglycan biosynthesis transport protein ExoP